MSEDVMVSSFPGIYAQVLSNLLQNSIMHAFEGVDKPKIVLEIMTKDDEVSLRFYDNGVGIDKSVKDSMFEPFVTTKRNQGGSGLGLNIVYNLVTQKLHGSIEVLEDKEIGTEFYIKYKTNIIKRGK